MQQILGIYKMRFSEWMENRKRSDDCKRKVKSRYKVWPSAYASGALVKCRKVGAKNWGVKSEGTFELEKERGLKGWFDRNHGKGWIDCRASTEKKKVPCGRKKAGKGAERKYPACRPNLSACNKKGTRRKKGKKRVSWD
jgi:hypothetical protein